MFKIERQAYDDATTYLLASVTVPIDVDSDGDLDLFIGGVGRNEVFLSCGTGFTAGPQSLHCLPTFVKPEITLTTPSAGETRGDVPVLLQGSFGSDPNAIVTVGGDACLADMPISYTMHLCNLPEFHPEEGDAASVDMVIHSFGRVSDPSQFVYAAPTLSDIQPRYIVSANDFDGFFELVGESFGGNAQKDVRIGSYACEEVQSAGDEYTMHERFRCKISGSSLNDFRNDIDLHAVNVTVAGQSIVSPLFVCHAVVVDYGAGEGSELCICPSGSEFNAASNECVACPANMYSNDGLECKACPLGAIFDADGSCECPQNSMLNPEGSVCWCKEGYSGDASNTNIGCTPCGARSYKSSPGNSQCEACPLGATIVTDTVTATSGDECGCPSNSIIQSFGNQCVCDVGFEGMATMADIGCSPCSSTSYKTEPGNVQCTPCPLGGTVSGDSSSCTCPTKSVLNFDQSGCECIAGHQGDATAASVGCVPCGATSYKSSSGNQMCTQCPLGATVNRTDVDDPSQSQTGAIFGDDCGCPANSVLSEDGSRCECAAGFRGDATTLSVGCSPCDVTAYKPSVGNAACIPCPAGSIIPEDGGNRTNIMACECKDGFERVESDMSCQCGKGYFGSNIDGCTHCPVGQFKDVVGDMLSCFSCEGYFGAGATTVAVASTSKDECVCGMGYYFFEGECKPCEFGALCPGGDVSSMIALPGFWRSSEDSRLFYSCESPNGVQLCEGQLEGTNHTVADPGAIQGNGCRLGHTGILCSSCEEGFGKTYGVCADCASSFKATNYVLVILSFLFFIALFLGLVSRNVKQAVTEREPGTRKSKALSVVKIVINWLQMACLAAKVGVNTNKAADSLFSALDMSNLSPWQFSSFNCAFPSTYYNQFYTGVLVPPSCLGVAAILVWLYKSKILPSWFYPNRSGLTKAASFKDLYTLVVQMLWFLTYSMVSQTILGIFPCRKFDGGLNLLSADLSLSCDDRGYSRAEIYGFVFAALYVVGIPLQVFLQLFWYRRSLHEERVRLRYLFLFNNYREKFYWYECICMLRKMFLSAVLVLLQDDPGNQTFALSLVSTLYLTLHSYLKPYSSAELNELETGTLFVTVLTLSLCTFFYTNSRDGLQRNQDAELPLTWVIIVLSILLVVWSLFLMAQETADMFTPETLSSLPSLTRLKSWRTNSKGKRSTDGKGRSALSTLLPTQLNTKAPAMSLSEYKPLVSYSSPDSMRRIFNPLAAASKGKAAAAMGKSNGGYDHAMGGAEISRETHPPSPPLQQQPMGNPALLPKGRHSEGGVLTANPLARGKSESASDLPSGRVVVRPQGMSLERGGGGGGGGGGGPGMDEPEVEAFGRLPSSKVLARAVGAVLAGGGRTSVDNPLFASPEAGGQATQPSALEEPMRKKANTLWSTLDSDGEEGDA